MFYPFYDSGMCFFPEKMMEAYKAETFTGEVRPCSSTSLA